MEKFKKGTVSCIVSSGLPLYIEKLCAEDKSLEIYADFSDNNIELQFEKSCDIPEYVSKTVADIFEMIINLPNES